jgi:cation transporter-like permease
VAGNALGPQNRRANSQRSILVAAAVLLICLVAIGVYAWLTLRDSGMSVAGEVVLGIGILATLALGVGLMSLLFYSNRAGFDDDIGRGDNP